MRPSYNSRQDMLSHINHQEFVPNNFKMMEMNKIMNSSFNTGGDHESWVNSKVFKIAQRESGKNNNLEQPQPAGTETPINNQYHIDLNQYEAFRKKPENNQILENNQFNSSGQNNSGFLGLFSSKPAPPNSAPSPKPKSPFQAFEEAQAVSSIPQTDSLQNMLDMSSDYRNQFHPRQSQFMPQGPLQESTIRKDFENLSEKEEASNGFNWFGWGKKSAGNDRKTQRSIFGDDEGVKADTRVINLEQHEMILDDESNMPESVHEIGQAQEIFNNPFFKPNNHTNRHEESKIAFMMRENQTKSVLGLSKISGKD